MGLLSKYIKLIFKRFNGETVEEYVENVPTVPGALSELNVKLGGNENDIKATDTKVHALGRIYKTLGGTDDTSRIYTTAQMIRKITEVAEQGESGGAFSFIPVPISMSGTGTVYVTAFYQDSETYEERMFRGGTSATIMVPALNGEGQGPVLSIRLPNYGDTSSYIVKVINPDGSYSLNHFKASGQPSILAKFGSVIYEGARITITTSGGGQA